MNAQEFVGERMAAAKRAEDMHAVHEQSRKAPKAPRRRFPRAAKQIFRGTATDEMFKVQDQHATVLAFQKSHANDLNQFMDLARLEGKLKTMMVNRQSLTAPQPVVSKGAIMTEVFRKVAEIAPENAEKIVRTKGHPEVTPLNDLTRPKKVTSRFERLREADIRRQRMNSMAKLPTTTPRSPHLTAPLPRHRYAHVPKPPTPRDQVEQELEAKFEDLRHREEELAGSRGRRLRHDPRPPKEPHGHGAVPALCLLPEDEENGKYYFTQTVSRRAHERRAPAADVAPRLDSDLQRSLTARDTPQQATPRHDVQPTPLSARKPPPTPSDAGSRRSELPPVLTPTASLSQMSQMSSRSAYKRKVEDLFNRFIVDAPPTAL